MRKASGAAIMEPVVKTTEKRSEYPETFIKFLNSLPCPSSAAFILGNSTFKSMEIGPIRDRTKLIYPKASLKKETSDAVTNMPVSIIGKILYRFDKLLSAVIQKLNPRYFLIGAFFILSTTCHIEGNSRCRLATRSQRITEKINIIIAPKRCPKIAPITPNPAKTNKRDAMLLENWFENAKTVMALIHLVICRAISVNGKKILPTAVAIKSTAA